MKVGPQFPLKGGQERLWQRGLPLAVEDLVEDVEPVLLLHLLLLRPRVVHLRRIRRPVDAALRRVFPLHIRVQNTTPIEEQQKEPIFWSSLLQKSLLSPDGRAQVVNEVATTQRRSN